MALPPATGIGIHIGSHKLCLTIFSSATNTFAYAVNVSFWKLTGSVLTTAIKRKTALTRQRYGIETGQVQSSPPSAALATAEPALGLDPGDNALAETINGLYKAEVIHRRGPWRSFEAVEFAALEWVDWFNNRRLLEPIGSIPPAEAEQNFYAKMDNIPMAA